MLKEISHIPIVLGLLTPVVLSAGALERYSVPQQQMQQPGYGKQPGIRSVDEDVYTRFRDKVSGYSEAQKEELIKYYSKKKKQAYRDKNYDAVSHYARLIDILH